MVHTERAARCFLDQLIVGDGKNQRLLWGRLGPSFTSPVLINERKIANARFQVCPTGNVTWHVAPQLKTGADFITEH